ncbi:peptidyl-tRNA hydrolase ICT1, mitochondrial [Chiloscyllium plagiosum]|uniref:peptidyl-tRNA hydrolase ICT1, mitochondrial n=1 Tax=Chiloscyllium plagiosum TaxID=36176 RepID=UPI001CB86663|nr:peptidyl-tRNA hydrolase ICT1, mitochondrial [Chiloscyllium plagiosum]
MVWCHVSSCCKDIPSHWVTLVTAATFLLRFNFIKEGAQQNTSSTDIPIDRLTVTYCRSSGPGGQNVNKVNTKAEVRFHVATADWLSEDVRSTITAKYQNRINRAGQLIVTSEVSRYQMKNLADCLQKIRNIVAAASQQPKQPSKEDAETRRMR